jgi:hypothetical protein
MQLHVWFILKNKTNWSQRKFKPRGAHHNTWIRCYLMTDVSRTLHAKPLGVSKA